MVVLTTITGDDLIAYVDDQLFLFLNFVLSQYIQEGVGELDQSKLPDLLA